MTPETIVHVWKADEDGEHNIMSFSVPGYPSYRVGDTIFLEKDVLPSVPEHIRESNKSMKLTKFVIDEISHSVRQSFVRNSHPDMDNPLPFRIIDRVTLDLYVDEE